MELKKTCICCRRNKLLVNFYKTSANRYMSYCIDCNKLKLKKYRKQHKLAIAKSHQRWHFIHREEALRYRKQNDMEIKEKVLTHYGKECACCGEANVAFLTIDHINEDGYKDRHIGTGVKLYRWIIKWGYPNTFQTLCIKCNSSKTYNSGVCVHKLFKKKGMTPSNKIKSEVLLHYSNNQLRCDCCSENELDFLTIDHINDDGAKHRKKLRKKGIHGGSGFYYWLKRNHYPAEYRVLCLNCNFGRFYNNGICPHLSKERSCIS